MKFTCWMARKASHSRLGSCRRTATSARQAGAVAETSGLGWVPNGMPSAWKARWFWAMRAGV